MLLSQTVRLLPVGPQRAGEAMPKTVRDLPEDLDPKIARVKLETMGLQIDTLTDEQVVYATDYSAGT